MSVSLMAASCDSIGSCSLDVEVEPLAESPPAPSPSHHHQHHRTTAADLDPNAASLSQKTLHSLLLSTSAHSNGHDVLPSDPEHKKPSYLNLACSISGYGGITTYDSKLREGFRSRDHSPAGKLREASPARGCGSNFLRTSWTPSPVDMKSQRNRCLIGGTNGTTAGSDQTDATANGVNLKRLAEQRNRWLEATLSPPEYHQNVFDGGRRRGLNAETTTMEHRYELNTSSHSTLVSSTTVFSNSNAAFYSNNNNSKTERIIPVTVEKGTPPKSYGRQSEDTSLKIVSNGSSVHHTPTSTKSFIQQRVERLYGPCALAQGFFHRSCKNPTFSSPASSGTNGFTCQAAQEDHSRKVPEKPSSSSSELPVLRHLRPEFRDQLPVAPRRSAGSRISCDLVAPKSSVLVQQTQLNRSSSQLQHQTSTESLADLQPAAPEVVLPQHTPSLSFENKSDLASTALVKEALVEQRSVDPKSSNLDKQPDPSTTVQSDEEENAGHKFLRIQRQTIEKLLKLAEKAENEIESSGKDGNAVLSEEALGHLRVAAGQARLLVRQKMVQFEGLCHKCINQSPNESFPTTAEDLQGFWDMLLLQVEQVNNTFQRLDKLRAVGWCEDKLPAEETSATDGTASRPLGSASKRTPRTSKAAGAGASGGDRSSKSAEAAAVRKQRDEERRRIMEQRRKELKQQQEQQQDSPVQAAAKDGMVEIFGAQPS